MGANLLIRRALLVKAVRGCAIGFREEWLTAGSLAAVMDGSSDCDPLPPGKLCAPRAARGHSQNPVWGPESVYRFRPGPIGLAGGRRPRGGHARLRLLLLEQRAAMRTPAVTMFANPVEQRVLETDVMPETLRLQPFMPENLLPLGEELLIQRGLLNELV